MAVTSLGLRGNLNQRSKLRNGAQVKMRMRMEIGSRGRIDNIHRMRDAFLANLMTRAAKTADDLQFELRADAPWADQDDDAGPRADPNKEFGIHAREGLYARPVRKGDVIGLEAGFSNEVYQIRYSDDGERTYTYGGILETWEEYGGKYAIIGPKMEEFEQFFLDDMRLAFKEVGSHGATFKKPKGPRR